ncbi:hypothetical protein [Tenacibaculum piscium]|uniref:DUF1634 domain-containing protein n=1 Tax=Tenacibaculum piscium TaxID=1458515 RepID=A0A2H1YHQ2_9FLAO|nr:hypothetical protein [Tenacibaculum piscium]MBE7629971.1 hypothetical protein [Tenacibaculum piscium]MBE7670383.1 hypothetical protein [Tenacibaculum piscium]MBE7685928.1 hypothetical protein [Tenacibaculum piscium]MBE7690535.1 hypothetical protein [Tenacibaculum piscium]MCG8183744.1 hypothetical protein [Tenacibaculum piscium]
MGYITKEIIIGIFVAILATIAGFYLYLEFISVGTLSETFIKIREGGVLGSVLALASIPNLVVFWIFLKKNQEYRARGVLIITVIIALLTFILKFL